MANGGEQNPEISPQVQTSDLYQKHAESAVEKNDLFYKQCWVNLLSIYIFKSVPWPLFCIIHKPNSTLIADLNVKEKQQGFQRKTEEQLCDPGNGKIS